MTVFLFYVNAYDMPLTDNEAHALKLEYAAALLRQPDTPEGAYNAAFAVCGENKSLALQIGRDWPKDATVKAEKEKLLNSGESSKFLPSKDAQAKDIYAMACDSKLDGETRLKAHRLYAEIRGNITKPEAPATGMQVLNQGVMIVKSHGTDEEWEQTAMAEQRRLMSQGHASVN